MSDPSPNQARRVNTDVAGSGGSSRASLTDASKGSGCPRDRIPEVVSPYPIVELSTDALLTTTRSVRKRLI